MADQAIILVRNPRGRLHTFGPHDIGPGFFGAAEVARQMAASFKDHEIRVVPLEAAWALAEPVAAAQEG
jgi:hypothetical protein